MRNVVLSVVVVVVIACGGSTADEGSLATGLDAYWKLDGNANDSSGHGLVLAPSSGAQGNLPSYKAGKIGPGLYPGVSQIDYTCPECAALQTQPSAHLDMSGDFTVSMWASRTASTYADPTWYGYALFDNGQVALAAQGQAAAPAPAYPRLSFFANGAEIAFVEDPTFDFRAAASTDVWVHLVAFRRGTTIGIRVNGKETTATFAGTVGAQSTFYLAQRRDGYPWQGTVDEVGKWGRALTGAEMDQLYAKGAGMTLP